jgi:hypothetical protein
VTSTYFFCSVLLQVFLRGEVSSLTPTKQAVREVDWTNQPSLEPCLHSLQTVDLNKPPPQVPSIDPHRQYWQLVWSEGFNGQFLLLYELLTKLKPSNKSNVMSITLSILSVFLLCTVKHANLASIGADGRL